MTAPPAANGVLLVDKPAAATSHDVVAVARRALGLRKVGHAGTLDPFATGLLVLGTGRATRLLEYLVGLDKAYDATARMGVATDTLDPDGERTATDERWRTLSEDAVARAVRAMVGPQMQTPPAHSALKVDGVPAHRRVRRGERVRLPARRVVVGALEIAEFVPPLLRLRVECSSGTYVRSLARDLGERLGTACHLVRLRRTRVGPLRVERAVSTAALREGAVDSEAWVDPISALSHLPVAPVGPAEAERLACGRSVAVDAPDGDPVAFVRSGERLVAVGSVREGTARPRKVFGFGAVEASST